MNRTHRASVWGQEGAGEIKQDRGRKPAGWVSRCRAGQGVSEVGQCPGTEVKERRP